MKNYLIIDRWTSSCGNCKGSSVDPLALAHTENLGVSKSRPCGETYTHVTSNYTGMKQSLVEMRPDLEYEEVRII